MALKLTNPNPVDHEVANPGDPFFPALNLKDFQEIYQVNVDALVTLERQVLLSMADCNQALSDYQADQVADGVATLPADHAVNYSEAVFARAFGLLLQIEPGETLSGRLRDGLDEMNLTPDDYFRRSADRLARIEGEGGGNLFAAVI